MSITASPVKVARTPKVTTKRTQRNLHRALERANGDNDKTRADHIKNILNGATLLNPPNIKKVKK